MLSLVAAFGLVLTSCDDDDDSGVAKAVLASVSVINYDSEQATGQLITVYSDATWTCEHPDWVTVEPETGSGTTEVRISVADNMRDGAEDLPRTADVVFKGILKSSEAHVIIRQSGNPYRDMQPVTIAEMESVTNGMSVIINDVTVATVYPNSFIATDGTRNVLVKYDGKVVPGDVLNLGAAKDTDPQGFPVLTADRVAKGTKSSSVPEAVDVTDKIDSWKGDARTLVKVTGKVNGNSVVVNGASNSVVVADAPSSVKMSSLDGHSVTLSGYYGGTATPAFYMNAADVEDHGIVEVIYFSEDFEWLADWLSAEGQTVETDNPSATADNLVSKAVTHDGVTLYQKLLDKGYTFLAEHAASKSARTPDKQIYGQKNYLKFGLTGYYSGMVIPIKDEIPATDELLLKFNWCSMRQGSGKWDPTELVVIVETNGNSNSYPVPALGWEDNHVYEWVPVEIEIPAGEITKGTKITIRNADSQWPDAEGRALRWFIDNIKIIQK